MPIHKRLVVQHFNKREEDRYLCNQASVTTKEKLTDLWEVVNCKNCLLKRLKPN